MRHQWSRKGWLMVLAAVATVVGSAVALRYASTGLALTHYDARGHLIVARRIFDSLTPGWQQIGAVWLPLPHLLNAVPVQYDAFYRTGASAIAMSIMAFAMASTALTWIVLSLTGSWTAALAGTLVFALNPNVLYLQSTPMTELPLIALVLTSTALLLSYCQQVVASPSSATGATAARADVLIHPRPALVGGVLAFACLTRYEAWPAAIGSLAVAPWVLWRRGIAWPRATRAIAAVAVYPIAAILGFTVFSRVVVGAWFASGFFVPENPAQGHPLEAIDLIVWGLRELSGLWLTAFATVGLLLLVGTALFVRDHSDRFIPVALLGMAAVPWSAFVDGHPYRIRYMVPLIAVQGLFAGVAAGSWRRTRVALTALLIVVGAAELRPLDSRAPMVVEAQWDRPNIVARRRVTSCLQSAYDGESVMASMGSLGHYMQDLSTAGFSIRDFIHEGNGDIWLNALDSPRPFAGWILIEEKAEGGDMLDAIARARPGFLDGYTRKCEAAGVALYRRVE